MRPTRCSAIPKSARNTTLTAPTGNRGGARGPAGGGWSSTGPGAGGFEKRGVSLRRHGLQRFLRADVRLCGAGGAGRSGFGGFDYGETPLRGQDIEADILVTLEEAQNGSSRQISFRRGETGRVETYTVKIPKGVHEGQRIRLAGQGASGAGGGQAGDLFLRVKFERHPDFDVQGSDVYYELDLPVHQAVLGGEVTVPTLDGRAKLKIREGSQNGQKFRMPQRGLTGKGGVRGDFYVVLNVTLPTAPSEEEKELWRKIAALEG